MNKKIVSIAFISLGIFTTCSCSTNIEQLFTTESNESNATREEETTTEVEETTTRVEETTTDIDITTTQKEKKDYSYQSFIDEVFGEDTIIYNVSDTNPYGIDLSKYGSNISAIFYEPKDIKNPYTNVSREDFYKDYDIALTYEDAMNRSACGLISGDITPQDYLPKNLGIKEEGSYIRSSSGTYILSKAGEYLGYIPNTFGFYRAIYYGGGYTSLDDVAAYLLAFGELPSNSNYGTASRNRSEALEMWGEYARVNNQNFSGDVEKFPYEPLLPRIMGDDSIYYTETDFGTKGGYTYTFYQREEQTLDPYNDGEYISRGICRFVFVSDYNIDSIDDRYVFYTYNHYNDFQEYLNYDGGWGLRFGCESAGNLPCSSRYDYDEYFAPSTTYSSTIIRPFTEFV